MEKIEEYKSIFKEDVEKDVKEYVTKVQKFSDEHFKKTAPNLYKNNQTNIYSYKKGPKWIKVFYGTMGRKEASSVFAFIDKETGDIYKPASWKAPAKGIRGNINDSNPPLDGASLYRR